LDAQRLAEVLLDSKHIPLEETAKRLNTPTQKIKGVKHGKVTKKYIDYNINDVQVTYEVYEALSSSQK
jgi:preprotein translocase subunit SecY